MSSQKNIVLVNPPVSRGFEQIESTFSNLPPVASLPLLACETERRSSRFGTSVPRILAFDRPQINQEFLATVAEADILGLSTWFSNYDSAVAIARVAKEINPSCKIVFGGPNATNLGSRILANRPFIDHVVVGDGEDVLWRLGEGQALDQVPNLWYRDNRGDPTFTFSREICLDEIEPFDFRHVVGLDLSMYNRQNFEYTRDPSNLSISTVWIRGCPKAVEQGRCGYCSIPDKSLRCMKPDNAWAQLESLHKRYGIISFFEGGDDFSCGSFAEELASCANRLEGIHLRAYSGLRTLSDSKLEAFTKVGVSELFIGIESTNPRINRWSGREISPELVFEAFSRLENYGIKVCISFLFGLPSESRKNLLDTESLVYELVNRFDNIRVMLVSLAVPLIGSRWFSQLMNDPFIHRGYRRGDLTTTDSPDYAHLSELSIHRHCTATLRDIVSTVCRIRSRLPQKVSVGDFGALASIHEGRYAEGKDLAAVRAKTGELATPTVSSS